MRKILQLFTGSRSNSGTSISFGGAKEDYEAKKSKLHDLEYQYSCAQKNERDAQYNVENSESDVKAAISIMERYATYDNEHRYRSTIELAQHRLEEAKSSYKSTHEKTEKLAEEISKLRSEVKDLEDKVKTS